MADISQIKLPDNSVYDIKDTVARTVMTGATDSANGAQGQVPAPTTADAEKFLRGDGTWQDGGRPMVILSYGSSTWQDFINAYNNNVIVYCRASSNSNPASGSQTRMAFMAYVNANPPTEVEFQYYRSVNTHSITQQGDQVFIYKLTSANKWTVTVREASAKIVAGEGLSSSYSSDTLTISRDALTASDIPDLSDTYATVDHTHSNYLTQETDPTVPSWAKASSKPTYTASEVGALPDTTIIPTKTSDLINDSEYYQKSKTVEATSLVRITDAAPTNLKSCSIDISPVQDLHGYDSPWPAGGGKNKFNIDVLPTSYVTSGVIKNNNGSITVRTSPTSGGIAAFKNGNYLKLSDLTSGLVVGETYFLSFETTGTKKQIYLSTSASTWNEGTSRTITQNDLDSIVYFYASGSDTEATLTLFQIEAGSSQTTYSPYSNICPITGWTGAEVTRTGKNLLNYSDITDYSKWSSTIAPSGNMPSNDTNRIYLLPKLKSGLQYTISFGVTPASFPEYLYFGHCKDGVGTRLAYITSNKVHNQSFTFTADEDVTYCLRMGSTAFESSFDTQISKLSYAQLELGSTATAYEPYTGDTYSITFPSSAGTVYGGTLTVQEDGTGELVVDRVRETKAFGDLGNRTDLDANTRAKFEFENTPKFTITDASTDLKCNLIGTYSTTYGSDTVHMYIANSTYAWVYLPVGTESSTEIQLSFTLATPQTYTLTAPQVELLKGLNYLWADTGDMACEYYVNIEMLGQLAYKDMITAYDVGALPSSTIIPSKTSDLTNDSGFISNVPVMTGATSSADGAAGLVPAPLTGDESKYLRGDGTWQTVSAGNTYTAFIGATSSTAGSDGLVPGPASGDIDKYLCSDGTWVQTATDADIDAIFTVNHFAAGQYF